MTKKVKKQSEKNLVTLNVTSENFATIRLNLNEGKQVNVNDKVTLVSFIPNTERISESGKKVRTPYYYVTENGKKLKSFELKELLSIEPETKGSRKETTFASVWEQLKKLADTAATKELQEAAKELQEKAKAKASEEKRAKEERIAQLEKELAALKG